MANRDLGTITGIEPGKMTVRLDGKTERTISFDPDKVPSLDHGYAVTSHSSQVLTERRVIVNIDTEASRNLSNSRLAYVAISRAEQDARIYTNAAANLGQKLAAVPAESADRAGPRDGKRLPRKARSRRKQAPLTTREQRSDYEYTTPEDRLKAVARDYSAQKDRAVVLAPDAAERKEVTQLIRAELQSQGKLPKAARFLCW